MLLYCRIFFFAFASDDFERSGRGEFVRKEGGRGREIG